jgi:ribosome-binding protein aMBF1 (putative translation factor)
MTVNLAAERINRGHSIRSLAVELDVHQHTIRKLEAGESVHPAAAKKVADFIGCKVTDFAGFNEDAAA